jgi:hypothetical protein
VSLCPFLLKRERRWQQRGVVKAFAELASRLQAIELIDQILD